MPDRSKLLDILEGSAPAGAGGLLGQDATAPVGTDAIDTAALERQAPPPPAPEVAAPAEGEEVSPGIQSILGGPEMSPQEREELQRQLALAARQHLAGL